MVVFGIDPGSTVTGYGVVERRRGRVHYIASGAIRTNSKNPIPERLAKIYDGLAVMLALHRPGEVAIEAIFRHKSSESALRLGQARGVALLAAAKYGASPYEYNAMVVKRTVGAHGRADKNGVARMVKVLLGIEVEDRSYDETDALAIAITHCSHARMLAAGKR